MEEAKISIIVPVYNCESYLCKCVDSLLWQTYKNIEIVLVDDGSTDNSPSLCDDYADKDARIKVFHKKNGGPSEARNLGIKEANGDYLMFVDSDDWVEENFCDEALACATKNDVKIVSFGLRLVYDDHSEIKTVKTPCILRTGDAIYYSITDELPIFNYPCNKLFHRSLFENISFLVGYRFEDVDIMYKLFDRAGEIYVSDAVLYNYLQRGDNFSATYNSVKATKDRVAVWLERLPFLKRKYSKAYSAALKEMTDQSIDILLHFWKSPSLTFKAINFLREYREDIKGKYTSTILRVGYSLHIF